MEVNFSTLHLHLRTPTLSCLCRLSVVFCPRAKCCPRMFTNHTNSVRIREIRVNSRAVTSVRAHLALGHLGGRGRGGAVSCLDGRWGGFRVARRARSWPAARGAVGFRGRGRRPPGGRGSGASRRHETALCAVHESPRTRDTKASGPLVETRKCFAPRSKGHGDRPRRAVHESSRIDTNFVHIREICVNSWPTNHGRAQLVR